MEAAARIIWSADVPSMRALGNGLRRLPELQCVKIDRAFLENRNPSVIARIQHDYDIRVFDDAKIVEIPTKVVEIANKHLKYQPWMLNCMATVVSNGVFVGDDPDKLDGLKRFADACHKVGTRPCAVTVLTSKTEQIVHDEFGALPPDQVLYYVELLLQAGFMDVVCSPQEVPVIRHNPEFDVLDLTTPGIVMPDSSSPDQARTNTPGATVRAGATREVIGRALTGDKMRENFHAIVADIETVAMAA